MGKNIDYSRLWTSITWSRQKLRPFRDQRRKFIEEYIGANYSTDSDSKENPVNLIKLAVDIHGALLTSASPIPDVTTMIQDYLPDAQSLELALEKLTDKMGFLETIEKVVFDALFLMGITKTGIENKGTYTVEGINFDITKPFVKRVDLDNWVYDFNANSMEECQFMGDRYRIPLEDAKENPKYNKEVAARLQPTQKSTTNEEGDAPIDTLSNTGESEPDEFIDHVELWDVWIPRNRMVVTLPSIASIDKGNLKPLCETIWNGPEEGPYDILRLGSVPNNFMPISPVSGWLGLHEIENRLWRKLNHQASRQKKVTVYQRGNSDDATRFNEAVDGCSIGVDGPSTVQEVSMGGIDQTTFAFAVHINNAFKVLANNLDTLGGLGAMSGTASQEKILDRNSSRQTKKMTKSIEELCSKILRKIAWFLYSDPIAEIPLEKTIPGLEEIRIPSTFSAQNRLADFFDFDISVKASSMQRMGPEERMDAVMRILMEVVIPLMPVMQEQGGQIDFSVLFDALARNNHLPEIKNILSFAESQLEQKPSGGKSASSPMTTHSSIRRNESEQTIQGQDANLIQSLMGSGVSPTKLAGVGGMNGQ